MGDDRLAQSAVQLTGRNTGEVTQAK
ncbi:hypothetical protein RHCRD62_80168 [Rhodococcus sp. RD6.2]|nr:hypothetical protein RHCRD62_80168 [Rhodococcus sp. RD6.2]